MTILAWIYVVTCALFFVALIVVSREPDKKEKEAMYPAMFLLLVLFVFSGMGMALGTLVGFPTVTW